MFKALTKMQSENWGGLASITGSLIALVAGDVESLISTASFVVSEISFIRKGHTSLGYSLGAAGISVGDGLLCFSQATAGNPILQLTMGALTSVWAVGAMRWPIEKAGAVIMKRSPHTGGLLQKTANIIPPLVGSTAILFRIPALYTSDFSGDHVNMVMFACNTFWGTADILLGRVQNLVKNSARTFSKTAHHMTRTSIEKMAMRPEDKSPIDITAKFDQH